MEHGFDDETEAARISKATAGCAGVGATAGAITSPRTGCCWRSCCVAGIGLRLAALSRSAVEHFDEGVYASNMYFGAPDYAYPQQRFYAPPLLPALIEAGMIVGLPPNVAALLPSFLAGCGTIVARVVVWPVVVWAGGGPRGGDAGGAERFSRRVSARRR